MSRFRVYPPSFSEQLRNLTTAADVTKFMNELLELRDKGQIIMRNGTFRKLWKQAHDRCDAINGQPLV